VSQRPSRFSGLSTAMNKDAAGMAESADLRSSSPERKRGRPPGKRSNPEYVQLTSYVREENLDEVKTALIKEKQQTGEKRDLSELIDSLLSFYVQEGDPWKLLRG
jgi:hypothetical protein